MNRYLRGGLCTALLLLFFTCTAYALNSTQLALPTVDNARYLRLENYSSAFSIGKDTTLVLTGQEDGVYLFVDEKCFRLADENGATLSTLTSLTLSAKTDIDTVYVSPYFFDACGALSSLTLDVNATTLIVDAGLPTSLRNAYNVTISRNYSWLLLHGCVNTLCTQSGANARVIGVGDFPTVTGAAIPYYAPEKQGASMYNAALLNVDELLPLTRDNVSPSQVLTLMGATAKTAQGGAGGKLTFGEGLLGIIYYGTRCNADRSALYVSLPANSLHRQGLLLYEGNGVSAPTDAPSPAPESTDAVLEPVETASPLPTPTFTPLPTPLPTPSATPYFSTESISLTYVSMTQEGNLTVNYPFMPRDGIAIFIAADIQMQREGYLFNGWSVTEGETYGEYLPGDQIKTTESLALYPAWMPLPHDTHSFTITYHLNYEGAPRMTFDATESAALSSDRKGMDMYALMTRPPDPSRDGYVFVGWSLSEDGTQIIEIPSLFRFTGSLDFYAVWRAYP